MKRSSTNIENQPQATTSWFIHRKIVNLFLQDRISMTEMMLLSLVYTYQRYSKNHLCFASNKYIGYYLRLKESRTRGLIGGLIKRGFLKADYRSDIRSRRTLKVVISKSQQNNIKQTCKNTTKDEVIPRRKRRVISAAYNHGGATPENKVAILKNDMPIRRHPPVKNVPGHRGNKLAHNIKNLNIKTNVNSSNEEFFTRRPVAVLRGQGSDFCSFGLGDSSTTFQSKKNTTSTNVKPLKSTTSLGLTFNVALPISANNQVLAFDKECALQLYRSPRVQSRVVCDPRLGRWAEEFYKLRKTLSRRGEPNAEKRIARVLSWYCSYKGERSLPWVYSAATFHSKFLRLEEHMKADVAEKRVSDPDVVISEEARKIAERLRNYHWPNGAGDGDRLEKAVQISITNQRDWRRRVREFPKKDIYEERVTEYIFANTHMPGEYVYYWFENVFERVCDWEQWHGNLLREVLNPDAPKEKNRFLKDMQQQADEYGSGGCWRKMLERMGSNAS